MFVCAVIKIKSTQQIPRQQNKTQLILLKLCCYIYFAVKAGSGRTARLGMASEATGPLLAYPDTRQRSCDTLRQAESHSGINIPLGD